MRIMFDPGHGGTDPGAIGNGLTEKVLNLQLAQLAARALAEKSKGYVVEIKLTRDQDETLSRAERLRRIAAFNPAICVSVHFNSATNVQATGTEVFHAAEDARDDHIAHLLIKQLAATGMPSRGLKTRSTSAGEDYYYIIREVMDHDTISVLLEGAFLSNAADANRIKAGWINQAAEAVAQAVFDCIKPKLKLAPFKAQMPPMPKIIEPTLMQDETTGTTHPAYIIDGTTYAPVRAVAEAAGREVHYNSTTKQTAVTERR